MLIKIENGNIKPKDSCSHSSLVKREMMGCGPNWLGQEILGFHVGNIIMDFLAHFGMRYMCM